MDKNSLPFIPEDLRILIVDDDKKMMESSAKAMVEMGFKAQNLNYAVNGQDAIDKIKINNYELVLMDIVMPVLNGIEAIKKIRLELKLTSLPIIVTSVEVDREIIISAMKIGANAYCLKPINIYDFSKKLFHFYKQNPFKDFN